MGTELQMLLCIGGIYTSYLAYGLLQEGIYKFEDSSGRKFEFTLTMLAIQCLANMIGALVGQALIGSPPAKNLPASALIKPAVSFIGAMFCSNQALQYVSYPVQALGKSCKMVPVLAVQRLWFKKMYTLRDYLMVALVTVGIIVFRYKSKGGENSAFGLVLLFLSLCLDGVTGPYQENVKKNHGANGPQIMFYCNMWAFGLLAVAIAASGEYAESLPYLVNPGNTDLLVKIGMFSVMSAVGQNFIFLTLEKFDALILTTVTTTRKCFTVAVSVVYYGHELSATQYGGIALVVAGLGLELYGKYTKSQAQKTSTGEASKKAV